MKRVCRSGHAVTGRGQRSAGQSAESPQEVRRTSVSGHHLPTAPNGKPAGQDPDSVKVCRSQKAVEQIPKLLVAAVDDGHEMLRGQLLTHLAVSAGAPSPSLSRSSGRTTPRGLVIAGGVECPEITALRQGKNRQRLAATTAATIRRPPSPPSTITLRSRTPSTSNARRLRILYSQRIS
jgi:hypothetical protein